MKKELHIFLTALVFFTRIPGPKNNTWMQEHFSASARYFPLIGWIVGGLSALVYWIAACMLPISLAVLCSMLFSVLITGGLHEDGLADVCDGFGGGWSKEKILAIMKDSHIGVYGVIALIFTLLLKFNLLAELFQKSNPSLTGFIYPLALGAGAHSISRFIAVTFMYSHMYAREEDSKAKNISKKMNAASLLVAGIFGTAPLLLFNNLYVFLIVVPLLIFKNILGRYFQKWINGYTGDCLGATQQISELLFYLMMLITPWKYI